MNCDNCDMIAEGFGPISGISRRSIEEVVRCPTLSGKKEIDGRQLISEAKTALKDAKILLSYWHEFKALLAKALFKTYFKASISSLPLGIPFLMNSCQ